MKTLRLLAIAASSRHVAYVFFIGERLVDWQISDRASASPESAGQYIAGWIEDFGPRAVISERPDTARRKGERSREILSAIGAAAAASGCIHVAIAREKAFPNKYAEAAFFAARYPDLLPWLPEKRIFYENEPRNTILFEAAAPADTDLCDPTSALARAWG